MISKWLFRNNSKNSNTQQERGKQLSAAANNQKITAHEIPLPKNLHKKVNILKPYLESNADIIYRVFSLRGLPERQVGMIYLSGVIDNDTLKQHVLKPLITGDWGELEQIPSKSLLDQIYRNLLTVGVVKKLNSPANLIQAIFDERAVLMVDGITEALALDIRGGDQRSIEEPPTEQTMRGSREGFNENLTSNTALIRRRLRDPNLVVENTIVGKRSRTDVAIFYIKDIADPKIVATVRERLAKINIDGVLATGYLEQMIEDNPYSLFPQAKGTERSDKVAAGLLEGRIAILASGTPFALLVPSLFVEFFQAPEDYYERAFVGSLYRVLTFLSFFLAVSLPALYVALFSFQIELIPFELMVPLARARKQVPFPVVVEVLLLEGVMQLIITAGLRLSSPLNQTVGVVSGIVIGQAAITAKLATPGVIIMIALATICTFGIPSHTLSMATRLIRLPVTLLSAGFGMFGFSFSWLIIIAHLANLESIGVPYLAPFAPTRYEDLKDSIFRTFFRKLKQRPASVPIQDRQRQGNMQRKR